MKCTKKMMLTLLVGTVVLCGSLIWNAPLAAQAKESIKFADVNVDAWYYPYVTYVVENNFMSGKDTDANGAIVFDPSSPMTRAEFVQTLYNREGTPEVTITTKFADVTEKDWYAKAVSWAAANDIVAGKGNVFDVNSPITREEMATVLFKYAGNHLGYSVKGRSELEVFSDKSKVSTWAVENMKWAIHYGVMAGKGNTVDPLSSATRAECATMLKNFMDAYTANNTIIGNHSNVWETGEDTRTMKCTECGASGITEYCYNGAWGYYDDEKANTLWGYVNITRNNTEYAIVEQGVTIGVANVDSLNSNEVLTNKARKRAVEAAIDFSHGSNMDECLAWGQGSPEVAMSAWELSPGHIKAITDPAYITGGIACFYYDSDGSGTNLTPIWVLELGY